MKTKRFYYEKEEQKITKTKGYIEIDMDYTQLYSCFNHISSKISSASSFHLLFWVLANRTNNSNGTDFSIETYRQFTKHLESISPGSSVTYRTFLKSVKELNEAGALTKIGKGHYYANPNMFWKDDTIKRVELIREELVDGNYVSLNPIDEDDSSKYKQLSVESKVIRYDPFDSE